MINLDIGCANQLKADTDNEKWIGIDLSSEDPRCIIRDLGRGLPFADKTFEEVKAHNVLEHIKQEDYIFVWNEIYRVLKPDGVFELMVPRHTSNASIQDPTHVRMFCPDSFQYFCDDGTGKTAFNGLSDGYGVKTLFKMVDNNFNEDNIIYFVVLKK